MEEDDVCLTAIVD
jgi:hypothetical protein